MALHFVSTAVLTADTSGQYNKEVLTNEGEKLKQQTANAGKSLYMQLAEKETLRQEQYDANAKLIRAGPRGLDDDDFEWVSQCQDGADQLEVLRREQEENELLQFKNNLCRPHPHKSNTASASISSATVDKSSSSNSNNSSSSGGHGAHIVAAATKHKQPLALPLVASLRKRKTSASSSSSPVTAAAESTGAVDSSMGAQDTIIDHAAKVAKVSTTVTSVGATPKLTSMSKSGSVSNSSVNSSSNSSNSNVNDSSSQNKSVSSLLAQYADSDSD